MPPVRFLSPAASTRDQTTCIDFMLKRRSNSNFFLWGTPEHGLRGLQIAPPWAFLGGVLDATYVLGSIIAIPQSGSVVVICSGIVGQMIGAYLTDTFGYSGVERVLFSCLRLCGIGFLLLGVFLVQRK